MHGLISALGSWLTSQPFRAIRHHRPDGAGGSNMNPEQIDGDVMKLAIIGVDGSGKTTVFEALTGNIIGEEAGFRGEARRGTISVPDSRIDRLSQMYQPQKTIYAQVEYLLPARHSGDGDRKDPGISRSQVMECDALILVLRNYRGYGVEAPAPENDFRTINDEMILSDLVIVEKRLERLSADRKRGKTVDAIEISLLEESRKILENETPLRHHAEIASAPLLRGFSLLSAKPLLILFNNEDDDESMPSIPTTMQREVCGLIRGKLEQELVQMTGEEAEEFLQEFNIGDSAMDRVIQASYALMGLISFFTVGSDEVRAWTIARETPAMEAAGVIHSDIQKGFIRAEVVHYDDLIAAGSHSEAKKHGTVRLEGKVYPVKDGDIINFRFNV
jgi:GTP-binding protein YchF